jgi:hypothetical protein
MRKYLSVALAGAALAACQQQTASEPTTSDVATETVTSTRAAVVDSGATATDIATPAAGAVANTSGPGVGDRNGQPPSGYDWAEAHHIDDEKDCTIGDDDFKDGCKLYVQEKAVDEGESAFESDGE